jgi:HEAT repeat protein
VSSELGGTPSRRLTHKQAVEIALNDPAARQAAAQTPLAARRRQLYAESAADILDELAVAGFPGIDTVGELYQRRLDYRSAVPILLEWLPKASYLMLSIDLVCALSASFAKKLAVPEFLRLFREPPPVQDPLRPATSPPPKEELRWFIAGGLGGFAGPPVADELIELALDRRFGWARYQIVEALPKTKDERVAEVLRGLLDDPTVRAAAVAALGKMKYSAARESIEVLLADLDKNVRSQAKKALKRIDSQL